MVSFSATAASLLALVSSADASIRSQNRRRLSYELIAGYEPRSQVTDHNALDLDQQMMEQQLALGTDQSFATAKNIYTNGAHSKSVASVTLNSGLLNAIPAKTPVSGRSASGQEVVGTTLEDYPAGATTIEIQYNTISIQAQYVGCQVGGSPTPNLQGCFAASGTLNIEGEGTFTYTYTPESDNKNKRTLQGFSLQSKEKMYDCPNCPYATYAKFYTYYGAHDYADKWVMAAFDSQSTSFSNGNANFRQYGFEGRSEAIKKGTAYMNVWMYVIREMEDALDDCQEGCTIENCNDDPVHAWDEAVAFYSGSLEGRDGSGSGVFLHELADKRCANFKTCGDLADHETGISHVNIEIFRQFRDGLHKITAGECSSARANKEAIEHMMAVPLIQGSLRYAYITDNEPLTEKAEAEGATFAAAVLPLVHACSEDAAQTIYDNLKTGQGGSANFAKVKSAFESTYGCLKVRCEDVGGLWDSALGQYMSGAEPCHYSTSEKNTGLIVGLSVGGIVLAGIAIVLWNRSRYAKEY
ncbi:low iron-inducible periplasmic protein [Nitzschia inconspicua]|uniref:Low iron-inducible periplasmic protein n=1 Tax=Nitzschia inconspicua TaxID=303405 RepID=A0A9K3KMB5_9STRA|nr:low iron-inducible periplasmic protein [Nitzschia inconspicua]